MAYTTKECRVCGKEYEMCRSAKPTTVGFRWQDVACSPECGAIYLQRIEESRGLRPAKKEKRKKPAEPVVAVIPEETGRADTQEEQEAAPVAASEDAEATPEV